MKRRVEGEERKVELFREKKDCCGCGACAAVCPAGAIGMKPDADGFAYPQIDGDLCVGCGLCREACGFQDSGLWGREPLETWAAVNKENSVLVDSASGGAFGALADLVLERGGRVFGCAYGEDLLPRHEGVDRREDLKKLMGSKYVQSDTAGTFREVQAGLAEGAWVLYVGTPCQIAGLRAYLKKDPPRLVTADLVCYGVPSPLLFKASVQAMGRHLGGPVRDVRFRDKAAGWDSLTARVLFGSEGEEGEALAPASSYLYYRLFLKGATQRESCLSCPFASALRAGDFTIGDYWGVEKAHPELPREKGVSVILANTGKAAGLMEKLAERMDLISSAFEDARAENGQLVRPFEPSPEREAVLGTWRSGGWEAVRKAFGRPGDLD